MTFNRLKILPLDGDYEPSPAPSQPVLIPNAVKVERPHPAHSRNNVHSPNGFADANGDLQSQHKEPMRSHRSSGSNSRKSSYRANSSSNSSTVNEPSDVYQAEAKYAESNYTEADSAPTMNTSLTEAAKVEDEPYIIRRKEIKQWLFTLIRKFKDDKDGGIRHQKVNLSTI